MRNLDGCQIAWTNEQNSILLKNKISLFEDYSCKHHCCKYQNSVNFKLLSLTKQNDV